MRGNRKSRKSLPLLWPDIRIDAAQGKDPHDLFKRRRRGEIPITTSAPPRKVGDFPRALRELDQSFILYLEHEVRRLHAAGHRRAVIADVTGAPLSFVKRVMYAKRPRQPRGRIIDLGSPGLFGFGPHEGGVGIFRSRPSDTAAMITIVKRPHRTIITLRSSATPRKRRR